MNRQTLVRRVATAALAIALVLVSASRTAYAQDYPFALSYYSNAHTSGAPDAVLRIVNDGNTGLNYTYTFVADTTGVITPKSLTVTATAMTHPGSSSSALRRLPRAAAS